MNPKLERVTGGQVRVGDTMHDGHEVLGKVVRIKREKRDDGGNYYRFHLTGGRYPDVLVAPDPEGSGYRVKR